MFRCFINLLPASRAQSEIVFYARTQPFIITKLALRIYLGFIADDSSPTYVENVKALMRAQEGRIMSAQNTKLFTDPILIYDVFAVNTPDGVQLDGFFDLSFYAGQASELQNCFNKISNDLEETRKVLSKYASPNLSAISVSAYISDLNQIYQSLEKSLKPIVESGALKLSATAAEYIHNFILQLFYRDVREIVYEVWDVNTLVVADSSNQYFDVFNTWDDEAEQRGWEFPAFDNQP